MASQVTKRPRAVILGQRLKRSLTTLIRHTSKSYLGRVPFDILLEILQELDVKSILSLRKCNRYLRQSCRNDEVWVRLAVALHESGIPLGLQNLGTSTSSNLVSSAMNALKLQYRWSKASAVAERVTFLPIILAGAGASWMSSISSRLIAFGSRSGPIQIWDILRRARVLGYPEASAQWVAVRCHDFVCVDERAWYVVFYDSTSINDLHDARNCALKILRVRLTEEIEGEPVSAATDIYVLGPLPDHFISLTVQVLDAALKKICVYFGLDSPDNFDWPLPTAETIYFCFFPDFRQGKMAFINTGVKHPGVERPPTIAAFLWDSEAKHVVMEVNNANNFSWPTERYIYSESYLLEHGKASIPGTPMRPLPALHHQKTNHKIAPMSDTKGFIRFSSYKQELFHPRFWYASRQLITQSSYHSTLRISARREWGSATQYHPDPHSAQFFEYMYATHRGALRRETRLRSETAACGSELSRNNIMQSTDYNCSLWFSRSVGNFGDMSSMKLICFSDCFPAPRSGGRVHPPAAKELNICSLQCPPELLNRHPRGVWLDAAHGRIILDMAANEVAILQYV